MPFGVQGLRTSAPAVCFGRFGVLGWVLLGFYGDSSGVLLGL